MTEHTCDDCSRGKSIEACLCDGCLKERLETAREEGFKAGYESGQQDAGLTP